MTPTADPLVPTTADEVAAALRRAADARQSIAIRGAGTKSGWGRAGAHADATLEMRSLNRVLAHEHGDMTATFEGGATLSDVNRALAQHRQWLPLDPPFADRATIGGILATNDSGPLRHRYGTPRDLVIGVRLATTDGVLSKAGGRVVKNVAGYDLGKLVAGSFGSLAAIVSATFKLAPIPAASKTLRIEVDDPAALATAVAAVMSSQLEPIAFEIAAPRAAPHGGRSRRDPNGEPEKLALLVRFASLPAVVDTQIEKALSIVRADGANARVLDGDVERSAWREHAQSIWTDDGAIVRASWLPANIGRVVDEIGGAPMIGRAGVGAGLLRIPGDEEQQARTVERLRASPLVGNIVVVRAADEVKRRVDVWGSPGDRQPLFASLKRAFDPAGILNPGRGPL